MFRLTQGIRNFFIRLEGLLYQFSNFLKSILAKVAQFIGYVAKLLGLTDTPYFVEDTQKNVKSTVTQLNDTPKTTQDPSTAANNIYRRPDAKMAEFLKMAQQSKSK